MTGSFSESAATLEVESGYSLESHQVAAFRRCILDGSWDEAESGLSQLGVTDEDSLLVCCPLVQCFVLLTPLKGGQISYQSAEISGALGDAEDDCCALCASE